MSFLLQIRIPHTNWVNVFDSNAHLYKSSLTGKGYDKINLPENLQVLLVQNPAHAKAALQILRASMQVGTF